MAVEMTEGPITRQLVGFTVPLVLGNLVQLTYNAADSIIVGRFLGDEALAAVGTSGPAMNMLILFISGLCMGAGILISTHYGSGDRQLLERQISTTLLGGLAFALAISAIVITFAGLLLSALQVPEDILPAASLYLRIVFCGYIFTFIYNFFSQTLRALGDSRTPLYFLIISALLNIFCDLFFVVMLGWGVAGSAIATVFSQAFCCISCVVFINLRIPMLHLGMRWFVLDTGLLATTVSYGITSALQQMCVPLGKLLVQAVVNTQGIAPMAAWAAITRVDEFFSTPQQNISHAVTTFMAQNRGAGNNRRMLNGFYRGIIIGYTYTVIMAVIFWISAEQLMRLFLDESAAQSIELGVSFLKLGVPMYLVCAATNIIQGFFRGTGDLRVTLLSTLINMSGRVASAYLFIIVLGSEFRSLAWSNMVGWLLMLSVELPLLIKSIKKYRGLN